jgi:hypothetical protein
MIIDDKVLAEKIGAVLIEARRYSSFVNETGHDFHKKVRAHLIKSGQKHHPCTTADRVETIYDLAAASFRTAVFEAFCYENYLKIWFGGSSISNSKFDEMIHLLHYFGNKVPLSLYTFLMYLRSVEFSSAFPNHRNAIGLFDLHFPKAEYARHAIAHEHDRNLGKAVLNGKPKLFESSLNLSSVTGKGYTFTDAACDVFEFKFESTRLSRFWDQFVEFVRSECV